LSQYISLLSIVSSNMKSVCLLIKDKEENINCITPTDLLQSCQCSSTGKLSLGECELVVTTLLNYEDKFMKEFKAEDQVIIRFIPSVNGKLLKTGKDIQQFCSQCFKYSIEEHKKVESFFSYVSNDDPITPQSTYKWFLYKKKERKFGDADNCSICELFMLCWSKGVLEKIGLDFAQNEDNLFWYLDENGLFCSVEYRMISVNSLKSIHFIFNLELKDMSACVEEYHYLPNALSRIIETVFLDLKSKTTSKELLLSKKEKRQQKIRRDYIPLVASSIQEICQLSTNIEFVNHCLQLLNISSIEEISEKIQEKLEAIHKE
jgi:hypothetical protein